MADTWDEMLANADAAILAEINADKAAYAKYTAAGNTAAATGIEKKYGLYGLSPQQVAEQLHQMALPEGGLQS